MMVGFGVRLWVVSLPFVGNLGNEPRLAGDVIGDPLNASVREMDEVRPGRVGPIPRLHVPVIVPGIRIIHAPGECVSGGWGRGRGRNIVMRLQEIKEQ